MPDDRFIVAEALMELIKDILISEKGLQKGKEKASEEGAKECGIPSRFPRSRRVAGC